MKSILIFVYLLTIAFVLFHLIVFYIETKKIKLNPRPRMCENGLSFSEVEKNKTQTMYTIEAI